MKEAKLRREGLTQPVDLGDRGAGALKERSRRSFGYRYLGGLSKTEPLRRQFLDRGLDLGMKDTEGAGAFMRFFIWARWVPMCCNAGVFCFLLFCFVF